MKKLSVKAGSHYRRSCPVKVKVEQPSEDTTSVELIEETSGQSVPGQLETTEDGIILHWLVDHLKAGEERSYQVSFSNRAVDSKGGVELENHPGERVDVRLNGELFTSYHYGDELARPFLHPVIGPFGNSITRRLATAEDDEKAFDHFHHRGLWTTHGEVNGVDNWSETKGHGRTVHKSFTAMQSGRVFATIAAQSDWVDAGGKKILEESYAARIYNLSSPRIIDLKLSLGGGEEDVEFGDTKEGGMASIRVLPTMTGNNGGRLENSYGGIGQAETWGKRAPWCDYSGMASGREVGVAIFDHPTNFRHPTYWHARDYGLMTANPFGLSFFEPESGKRGDHVVKKGDTLEFSYRIYIHVGNASEGLVRESYIDYINPPEVEMS